MKGIKTILLMVIAALCLPAYSFAGGLNRIIDGLRNLSNYSSDAAVTVQLPQGADVSYILDINSTPAPDDPLSDADYLIRWNIPDNPAAAGFTAYFNGNLYRYSDTRLTEYHYSWDSIPFLLGGGRNAVQNNAQFISYTPAAIASMIAEIEAGDGWTFSLACDSTFNGRPADIILAEYSRNGYTGKKLTIVLDPATSAPIYYESENNPTSISEQIITVRYSGTATEPFPLSAETDLISLYPEIFENYRQSNFSIENLRSHRLPPFSLPTTTGERYTFTKEDAFPAPTIIAVLDPQVATAAETVKEIRDAVAILPSTAGVIFITVTTDIDAAESTVGNITQGETLLINGKSFARDCGITSFPTLLFAKRDGTINDISIGFCNNLSDIVMEKTVLAN